MNGASHRQPRPCARSRGVPAALVAALAAACLSPAFAATDLRTPQRAGSLTVYPDDRRAGVFYWPPGDLIVATEDGRPDLRFLLARYTGSAATGDRGARMFRSILSFRVEMSLPSTRALREAKRALRSAAKARVDLRPLPIDHVETAVVYTPIGTAEQRDETRVLPPGHLEAADEDGAGSARSFWTERVYTLGIDPHTAQVLWDALQRGRVLISLGYAFHTAGLGPDEPLEVLSGSPELVAELERRIAERRESTAAQETKAQSHVVRAGTVAVAVDGRRWPELLDRVDLDERVPPGYAFLDVYCYDFNNDLRPDLHLKRVEFEARGVGGDPVSRTLTFRRGRPEVYAQGLRFPFAVRLDEPYRYRVVEVAREGDTRRGPWQVMDSWARLLDVTSRPGERAQERVDEVEEENGESDTGR